MTFYIKIFSGKEEIFAQWVDVKAFDPMLNIAKQAGHKVEISNQEF